MGFFGLSHSFLFIPNIKAKECTLCFVHQIWLYQGCRCPLVCVYALNRPLVKLLRYFVSVLQRCACCELSMSRLNKISLNSLISFMNITPSFFKVSKARNRREECSAVS